MIGPRAATVARPRSSARHGVGRIIRSRWIPFVLSLVFVLVIWQALGPIQPLFASYPSAIAQAAVEAFVPEMLPAWGATIVGYVVGLAIAIPIALVVGISMGRNRFIDIVVAPYVNALYVTPRIALIPILVLWFGLDFKLRVAIVVLSAVFPMIVNVYIGMQLVRRDLLDVGIAFMADSRQRLFTIILPNAVPYLFTGLRIGSARALGGVIVAEMTASFTGIGQRLVNYGTFFEIDKLFVGVISIGIFGLLLARGVRFLQARTAPWSVAVRSS